MSDIVALSDNVKLSKDSLELDSVNSSITSLNNSISSINSSISNLKTQVNNNWSNGLNINGSTGSAGIVSNLNKFYTGLTLVNGCSTAPSTNWWFIVSGGISGTTVQLAFSLFNNETAKMRNCAAGNWSSWANIKIS